MIVLNLVIGVIMNSMDEVRNEQILEQKLSRSEGNAPNVDTEIEDVKRSRIEEIMHETLHIIVQNVLLALQGCKKGELSMKRKSLNFAKRIEEVLLLQFPRGNNQAMLYLRQSVLLHIQVFINSQLFGSETYYKVIHEVV